MVDDVLKSLSAEGAYGAADEYSEFRLVCSGVLYNGSLLTVDWTKSDAVRTILDEPIALTVATRPIDTYPAELVLGLRVFHTVTEYGGDGASGVSASFRSTPHREVAEDIASLLTLLLRRLVTVHSQVSVTLPSAGLDGSDLAFPMPIAQAKAPAAWAERPSMVTYGAAGIEGIKAYAPPPIAVDSLRLGRLLSSLPALPQAGAVLAAARQYSEAMQLIEDRPDIAYVLLVSAVETAAAEALSSWTPTMEDMRETKRSVYDRALAFGLDVNQADALVEAACADLNWSTKRISIFLERYLDDSLAAADDLFHVPEYLIPAPGDVRKAIRDVLKARGKALHKGAPYPEHVGDGIGPWVTPTVLGAVLSGDKLLPPATWFERVANLSIVRWLESALAP